MWRLSDINKLFARVPLPNDVITVPELDDTLLTTHSAVESAKVCYAGPRLEDSAAAGSPGSRKGGRTGLVLAGPLFAK